MNLQYMPMDEFIEMRWRTYQTALENKEQMARDYDVPVDCIYIAEPPVSGEVICDICNRNITTSFVLLNEEGDYVYCRGCASETVKMEK